MADDSLKDLLTLSPEAGKEISVGIIDEGMHKLTLTLPGTLHAKLVRVHKDILDASKKEMQVFGGMNIEVLEGRHIAPDVEDTALLLLGMAVFITEENMNENPKHGVHVRREEEGE